MKLRHAFLTVLFACALAPPVHAQAQGIACTQEAKKCPNGSFVGRTGPHCEFAPCPGADEDRNAPPKDAAPPADGGHMCPMFRKLCPGGGSVGPEGPDCHVPPCPEHAPFKKVGGTTDEDAHSGANDRLKGGAGDAGKDDEDTSDGDEDGNEDCGSDGCD